MALAPPYDKIPALIPLAISQIHTLVNKIIAFLTKKAIELVNKANLLPKKNIKCDDPRIKNLKNILQKIKDTIDSLLRILNVLSTIVPIAALVANIASTILTLQLTLVPLSITPAPPPVTQTINIQNETIAGVSGALTQAGIIVTITTASISMVSTLLGPAINILSSICQGESFAVNQDTQNAILQDVRDELDRLNVNADIVDRNLDISQIDTSRYQDFVNSEFYRPVNVSIEDLNDRDDIIQDLLERQKNLIENILEAPSKSIVNTNIETSGEPDINVGREGDYYIDKITKTIYGPKISDNDWGLGLNY